MFAISDLLFLVSWPLYTVTHPPLLAVPLELEGHVVDVVSLHLVNALGVHGLGQVALHPVRRHTVRPGKHLHDNCLRI